MRLSAISRIFALSVLVTVPSLSGALADAPNGPFDGEWVVDVQASPVLARASESICPALRLPLRIESGHVEGELSRVPATTDQMVVEAGPGPDAAPIIGEVEPDGTVHASWENYRATGMLSGDTGQITIETECGPAQAVATRIAR